MSAAYSAIITLTRPATSASYSRGGMYAQKPAMQVSCGLLSVGGQQSASETQRSSRLEHIDLHRRASAHRFVELGCLGLVAKATAAIDPARACVAVLAARVERGERAVVARSRFLP